MQALETLLTDRPFWREGWVLLCLALFACKHTTACLRVVDFVVHLGDAAKHINHSHVAAGGDANDDWMLLGDAHVIPDAVPLLCASIVAITSTGEVCFPPGHNDAQSSTAV